MREIRIKANALKAIRKGIKTHDVRVAFQNIRSLQPGECVRLVAGKDSTIIRIVENRRYRDPIHMFGRESWRMLFPGTLTLQQACKKLRAISKHYTPATGLCVLEFRVEPKEAP